MVVRLRRVVAAAAVALRRARGARRRREGPARPGRDGPRRPRIPLGLRRGHPVTPRAAARSRTRGRRTVPGLARFRRRGSLPTDVGPAARVGRRERYNLYGPSESTVDALVARGLGRGRARRGPTGGRTRAYILDRWMRPAPIGVEGELYLAGRGLARGYLADPGRTADRFVADTIDPEFPGDRMYRTGDRALWTSDGHIRYRGRGDDQVKIRGYRIEPAEIETVLSSRPDVATAVVLARTDLGATARLVAYVVPVAGYTLDAETLRRAVARVLPDYMVPSATSSWTPCPRSPTARSTAPHCATGTRPSSAPGTVHTGRRTAVRPRLRGHRHRAGRRRRRSARPRMRQHLGDADPRRTARGRIRDRRRVDPHRRVDRRTRRNPPRTD